MDRAGALEEILKAYDVYYDVNRENAESPFVAEAMFHSHDEQFFLIRSASIGETESNEHVFFATADKLSEDGLRKLDEAAWEKGLMRVRPHANHRNTDVSLIVLSNEVEDGAFDQAKKLSHYKSYRMGFQGWSHYRLIVMETSSGKMICNRQGQNLKKLFGNIFH